MSDQILSDWVLSDRVLSDRVLATFDPDSRNRYDDGPDCLTKLIEMLCIILETTFWRFKDILPW